MIVVALLALLAVMVCVAGVLVNREEWERHTSHRGVALFYCYFFMPHLCPSPSPCLHHVCPTHAPYMPHSLTLNAP